MSRRSFLGTSAKALAACGLAVHFPASGSISKSMLNESKFHVIDQLHQILIVDGFGMPAQVSQIVEERTEQFKKSYPSAKYTLWSGEMLREFIGAHFGKKVLWAFDTLKPYAFKSDLARYCLLHAFGGLYSDLSLMHFEPWQIKREFAIAGYLEINSEQYVPYSVSNSLMWSEPSHPTFELAINRIVMHCETRSYGRIAIDPTGPSMLGWAWLTTHVAQWKNGEALTQGLGVVDVIWRDGIGVDLKFFPTGMANAAVAQRPIRLPGDARYLEVSGTNSYRDMWHKRDIYL